MLHLILNLSNCLVWIIWCFQTSHYFYMCSLLIAVTCIQIQILFYFWSERLGRDQGLESQNISHTVEKSNNNYQRKSLWKTFPEFHCLVSSEIEKKQKKKSLTEMSHIPSCLRGKNLSLNSRTLVSTKLATRKDNKTP